MVLNNISPAIKRLDDLANFITDSPNFELLKSIVRQRADVVHSSAKGLAVGEFNKGCKADLEYNNLAKEIEKNIFK